MPTLRSLCFLIPLCASSSAALAASESETPDFSREVLPLLSDRCFKCHGPDKGSRKGRLRLDVREAATREKRSGAAIVPGLPDESALVERILAEDEDDLMPPADSNLRLTEAEKKTLVDWIRGGAPYATHWSFRPIPPVAVPETGESQWPENPIDHFILRRLQQERLEPNPRANRYTLIRRLSLDLRGLPPTPEAADAFVADESPEAWERLVDGLLAEASFGQRIAQDWLDLARYADTNGYQGDQTRSMWPWRDWVVDAIARDLPFDEFSIWQLAGDLLPDASLEQRLATGFARNHMINGEGGRIPEENRVDYVMDMAETAGTAWLGLTFNCCRCHDHKFDPLSRRDYYALTAFFNQTPVDGSGGSGHTEPTLRVPDSSQERELERLASERDAALAKLERIERAASEEDASTASSGPETDGTIEAVREALSRAPRDREDDHWKPLIASITPRDASYEALVEQYRKRRKAHDELRAALPRVMVLEELPEKRRRRTYLLELGLYNKRQDEVEADVPESLPALLESERADRLALARWFFAEDNPLVARVVVNRIWQRHFGTGLVKTPEDFGTQGERPSHPQLLDWLAGEFRRSGWSLKHLTRLIVTSATWRQSSALRPELLERDPANRLLARAPRHRLDSWMIRDLALAASGLLVHRLGGPSVFPYQPEGVWADASFDKFRYPRDEGDKLYRRSLYTFWRRIVGPTVFFDAASRQYCTVTKTRTNTPLHALTTLNDTTYVEAARVLGTRVLEELPSASDADRLTRLFRRVLIRPPRAEESAALAASLARFRAHFEAREDAARELLSVGHRSAPESLEAREAAAWTALANVLLNLDEALSKE